MIPDWSGVYDDLVVDFNKATNARAVFDPDRVYRYSLTRTWDPDTPPVVWIMLNPSTADAFADDPTIRRCVGYAKTWGWGGIRVVNLFALRATHPRELVAAVVDPVGPANDDALRASLTADRYGPVVAAWGARGTYRGRDAAVLQLLQDLDVESYCLGVTGNGQPQHPLYTPASVNPRRYPPPGRTP